MLALLLAAALSSFQAIKTLTNRNLGNYYFFYAPSAPMTKNGYETTFNYVLTNYATFAMCDNGNIYECAVEVSSVVYISGSYFPSFAGVTFDSNGFPTITGTVVTNTTTDEY